ncbi:hypothetical protein EAG_02070 [Camponotus floridanus]|uniref:Uncharacterized protein n=1 Tax=Camponotus floridanus TaxID=104421 RepID=E2A4C7_CAMFO|nr:hypothetical protein EAG_02070 [Camponotus floridanus]
MPIARTVASTIAHEHCTTLLNHHHLRHWDTPAGNRPVSGDSGGTPIVRSDDHTGIPQYRCRIRGCRIEPSSLVDGGGHCTRPSAKTAGSAVDAGRFAFLPGSSRGPGWNDLTRGSEQSSRAAVGGAG